MEMRKHVRVDVCASRCLRVCSVHVLRVLVCACVFTRACCCYRHQFNGGLQWILSDIRIQAQDLLDTCVEHACNLHHRVSILSGEVNKQE